TGEQEYIGNFNPRATLGLTNTFQYKDVFFRFLIDGRIGGVVVSGTEMNLAFSGIPKVTESFREGNWSLKGVDANGAAVSATTSAQDFWQIASGKRYGAGEFFAYDATNIRLREVSLGINLPVKSLNIIQSARLSLVGRNLFFIARGSSLLDIPGIGTRKMWFDPDMSLGNGNFQGVEYGTLPSTRSLGVNLQVTF
ncbi:MAG: SusC/RagA family TonB-linked outer membrane protein, partial [Chitinophagaceae bacterium]